MNFHASFTPWYNSGWEELRYRYPSPGNTQSNGTHASRELERHHYKTPYYASRYMMRNYWDRPTQWIEYQPYAVFQDLDQMSPEARAKYLGFVDGATAYNESRESRYRALYARAQEANAKNESVVLAKTPQELMEAARRDIDNVNELDEWGDVGDFEGASEYITHPDTYLCDYGLHHWSSYDMMPHIELETMLEEYRDEILAEGQATVEGDANHWKVLDARHRMDQQKEVGRTLKQRNARHLE